MSKEQKTIIVEDGRRFDWFPIDNEVADNTAMSIHAKGAYMVLARHANRKTDECFLLMETIANKMGNGIAVSTARKAVAELRDVHKLVAVESRAGKSSIFRLLDVPKGRKDPAVIERGQEEPHRNGVDTPPYSGDHPAVIERHNKTDLTRLTEQDKSETPSPAATETKPLFAELKTKKELVKEVFDYGCKEVGHNPKTYRFTKDKETPMLRRFDECLEITGDMIKAKELMECAVDGLAADDWCMGRDARSTKKYNCLIRNCFKSYAEMEKRWNHDTTKQAGPGRGYIPYKSKSQQEMIAAADAELERQFGRDAFARVRGNSKAERLSAEIRESTRRIFNPDRVLSKAEQRIERNDDKYARIEQRIAGVPENNIAAVIA